MIPPLPPLREQREVKKKIEMRSLKKARKPISTFDRSKDNSEATKTWPPEPAKKLHAGWKYVPQLGVQIGRHSVREGACALFWWEGGEKKCTRPQAHTAREGPIAEMMEALGGS